MERNDPGQGFRARAMQLLSWLTGMREQEQQQHTQQADRQQFDGYTRGMDDPDNRRQQTQMSQRSLGYEGGEDVRRPREMGPPSGSEAAARVQVQLESNQAREEREEARAQQGRRTPDQLLNSGELQALRERLQAHHRALQQHQRSQGRGWGG
jgi:hypothetical protein